MARAPADGGTGVRREGTALMGIRARRQEGVEQGEPVLTSPAECAYEPNQPMQRWTYLRNEPAVAGTSRALLTGEADRLSHIRGPAQADRAK
jgi:hypothetical protein